MFELEFIVLAVPLAENRESGVTCNSGIPPAVIRTYYKPPDCPVLSGVYRATDFAWYSLYSFPQQIFGFPYSDFSFTARAIRFLPFHLLFPSRGTDLNISLSYCNKYREGEAAFFSILLLKGFPFPIGKDSCLWLWQEAIAKCQGLNILAFKVIVSHIHYSVQIVSLPVYLI